MERVMTLEEAADYLKIAKPTLYRLLEEGKIPAFKVGNQWRFTKELIDNWLWNQIPKVSRVLVVDDDGDTCLLIKNALALDGHNVVTTQTGKEAIDLIGNLKFDLAFLDIAIPDVNGVEVLKEIRKVQPHLPVIIITGFANSDLFHEALELGPLSAIKKPFAVEHIQSVMKIVPLLSSKENQGLYKQSTN